MLVLFDNNPDILSNLFTFQDGEYFDSPDNVPGNLITRLATDVPNICAAIDHRYFCIYNDINISQGIKEV